MGDLGVQPYVVEAVLNHISGRRAGVAGIYNRAACASEKRAPLAAWAERVVELMGAEMADDLAYQHNAHVYRFRSHVEDQVENAQQARRHFFTESA